MSVNQPATDQPTSTELTMTDLANRVGVPDTVVEVLYREGLLAARDTDEGPRFSTEDADAIGAGVALLDAGVPLDELLDLARRWDEQARSLADDAVELFLRFVRDPIQGSAASTQEASERLATAFQDMFPGAGRIVAHHFRGLLLERAAARIHSDGDAQELDTLSRVIPNLGNDSDSGTGGAR